MAKGSDMNEMIKVEDGEDSYRGDRNEQPFVLLLKVMQSSGKPLPIGGFTGRVMAQMLHDIAGVIPREVTVLTEQDMVMELEEETSMMEVLRAIHGIYHWAGQSIMVHSLVARKDSITEIISEQEISRGKKELEEHHRMKGDQQECQQQITDIGKGK